MPIANAYNPNPSTVDSILKKRQQQYDSGIQSGAIEPPKPQENPRFLGVEMTPDSPDKSFLRKVGEDAAMLAYAIPVGLTQAVTHPISFVKNAIMDESGDITRGALGQSVRDAVDPDYYKAHPLLGIVNLAGFVAPVAGAAKAAALKTATRTALVTATKEAVTLGVSESVARAALKETAIRTVVTEASKTGKTAVVGEVVRNLLTKSGVADDIAFRISNTVSDNLATTLSRQSAKLKVMESIAHPFGSTYKAVSGKLDPLKQSLFGSPAKTAVSQIYGADVVAKNPEGFLAIERWAEAQVKERGLDNTVVNRQRMMQEWTEQNSQWASLNPEQRVSHFKNYAEQDLKRLALHEQTGIDMVTTKALPQSYVDAMVATIKEAPETMDTATLTNLLEDTFGNDFNIHSAEIKAALAKGETREALINAVSKLGDSRSTISFAKFSPQIQELAKSLEQTGYRIGHAPKDKAVSFATDVFGGADSANVSKVTTNEVLATRTRLGAWLDKIGLSPRGVVEGAAEYSFRENFTQRALSDAFAGKYGGVVKAGNLSIPVEKLFEWMDKSKLAFSQARPNLSLPIRTVFDINADDLVRAGFSPEIAKDIFSMTRKSLREVPASITGMSDAVINYMRTADKGFGAYMSNWYDKYLKVAYKGRYDWSPFFSAQQFLETKIQSALLLKDARMLPGVPALQKLGTWTAEKLGKRLEGTKSYLGKIIDEPPIEEVAMVREEILGTLQKTMLDYTSSPDLINIQNAAKGGYALLKDRAAFEQSIRSRNLWYSVFGQSSVRMASTFNKALAEKFGMTLPEALSFTYENGVKKYKNPQMVQIMREATQMAYHYKEGVMTSPLMKTLNTIWFPLRFQAKTVQLMGNWLNTLSPTQKMVVMNNWVHFANWAGTDEGIEWRRTNRNMFYNILAYTTAYEQIGQGLEAVTKGRLFGGNAGLIGGVPFGVMVNLARELGVLPEDPDQFDPKTGRRFTKEIPKKLISPAALANSLEQLLISISPSTPFYSLTGGVIGGVSPRKWIESLVRQVVGAGANALEGRDPSKGRQDLERDFKRVPLDYSRLGQ